MKRIIKIGGIALLIGVVLTFGLVATAFADNGTGNGESSDCTGPGLENRWGQNTEAGNGTCLGNGYGQTSEGAGPGLENCWGKNAEAGNGTCLGNGYGQTSEGAGPGLQNCWGKNAQ